MRRREFITLASGAAIAWPLTACAQQRVPMIGVLRVNPKESDCRAVPTLHASGRGEERRNELRFRLGRHAHRANARARQRTCGA